MIRKNYLNRGFALASLLLLAACAHQGRDGVGHQHAERVRSVSPSGHTSGGGFDGKNSSFFVDGRVITLVNGASDETIENSSAKISTRYVGGETKGEFNGDGQEDHAFFVSQTTGGSGTFYYLVVALQRAGGYSAAGAFPIGDRIQPKSIFIRKDTGVLEVRYLDRKQGEPMAAPPSEEKILLLQVGPNNTLEKLNERSPT